MQTLELTTTQRHGFGEKKGMNTPNAFFHAKFAGQTEQYGAAFLELREDLALGKTKICPISINLDFFASILSDPGIGLSVVYFEPDMQFYFNSPFQPMYRPVSPEKLQNLYRGFLIKCAEQCQSEVNILNLFHEFRQEKVARQVTNRAKSVLAADQSFFSPTSAYQRERGPELHERLMRNLCETMLERREGGCLTVTQAYQIFCRLSEQRQLGPLKRSMFKAVMRDCVMEVHGLGLRRDVPDEVTRKQQEAWKGLQIVAREVLAG